MENNIHNEGLSLLDDFAKYDGFWSFDNLRQITQSINSQHSVYAKGVEYAVERYLQDVRDKINENIDKLSKIENNSSKEAINALIEIEGYISEMIDYPSYNPKEQIIIKAYGKFWSKINPSVRKSILASDGFMFFSRYEEEMVPSDMFGEENVEKTFDESSERVGQRPISLKEDLKKFLI